MTSPFQTRAGMISSRSGPCGPRSDFLSLSLFVVCTMLTVGVAVAQDASAFTIKTNNGTISIIGYRGTNSTLVIPATFGGLPVTSVDWLNPEGMGDHCGDARRVVLPESVTNLGYCLFEGCARLEDVNIPNGVVRIYCDTFLGCCVTNLVLPERLASIDRNAFVGARLGRLVIPDSVTNIGECAFFAADIGELVMPNGVTNIAHNLFHGANIGKLVWGSGVPVRVAGIAHVGFIVLRAGLKRVDDQGFMRLEGLTNVTFEGDAPATGQEIFGTNQDVKVYYYPGTKGWGDTFGGKSTFEITSGSGLGAAVAPSKR